MSGIEDAVRKLERLKEAERAVSGVCGMPFLREEDYKKVRTVAERFSKCMMKAVEEVDQALTEDEKQGRLQRCLQRPIRQVDTVTGLTGKVDWDTACPKRAKGHDQCVVRGTRFLTSGHPALFFCVACAKEIEMPPELHEVYDR